MAAKKPPSAKFTVPTMSTRDGTEVAAILQERLNALTDLHLTLKHVHWNVVGPHFIAVHEMLDPQVDAVRAMTDATAERIATLGVSPVGTPGALVEARTWDDYSLGRAGAIEHLGALEVVYSGVIEGHRKAIDATEDPDPVTQDMLIEQSGELELFHWFVRAHLESSGGELSTEGEHHVQPAAKKAGARARRSS
jgi:starvation-inducible DNA-binding protein